MVSTVQQRLVTVIKLQHYQNKTARELMNYYVIHWRYAHLNLVIAISVPVLLQFSSDSGSMKGKAFILTGCIIEC